MAFRFCLARVSKIQGKRVKTNILSMI
jgi:hypothetical protein